MTSYRLLWHFLRTLALKFNPFTLVVSFYTTISIVTENNAIRKHNYFLNRNIKHNIERVKLANRLILLKKKTQVNKKGLYTLAQLSK